MINDIHLAIFINEYDKKPIFMNLASFKDVNELDYYMNYHDNDNNKVRKEFDQEIFEYLLDNINQLKKVEEKTKRKFYGRISAYYYDKVGNMHFIELPKKNKIVVRDYKKIKDSKKCFDFLCQVFDKAESEIFKKYSKVNYYPTVNDFVYLMIVAFRLYGYEISDNEKYYLAKYFNNRNEKNKKKCLDLIKVNVTNLYNKKESNNDNLETYVLNNTELNNMSNDEEQEELICIPGSSSKLQYDLEMFKKTGNYEFLFGNHDIDEIDNYTNYYQKKKGKGK